LAYSTWFYIADILMVGIDLALYVRNARLDKARDAALSVGAALPDNAR
jgi:hypothetical protein